MHVLPVRQDHHQEHDDDRCGDPGRVLEQRVPAERQHEQDLLRRVPVGGQGIGGEDGQGDAFGQQGLAQLVGVQGAPEQHPLGGVGEGSHVGECYAQCEVPWAACSVPAVHIVILGCGRVGSALAQTMDKQGHSVAIIDQDPEAFRKLLPRLRRQHRGGDRLRSRHPHRGRDRPRPGLRGLQQRRQHEHHLRPGGPRDVRRGERRGPHLRPPARGGLPATGHPHRRQRGLVHRPDAAPPAPPRRPGGVDRRRAAPSPWPR